MASEILSEKHETKENILSSDNNESTLSAPLANAVSEPLMKQPTETVIDSKEETIESTKISKPIGKKLAERNAKKVSALSLKSIRKKQQMKEELVANLPDGENLPVREFDEESFQSAWKDYTAIIEAEGKYNLLSHLSMGVPKLDGASVHLEFPNDTIKLEVERAQNELLGFLREKLQNYDITLSIEVNETVAKKFAYTSREKFEKLKEKNPLIEALRKEFDLDV